MYKKTEVISDPQKYQLGVKYWRLKLPIVVLKIQSNAL